MTTWQMVRDLYRTDPLVKQAVNWTGIATAMFFVAILNVGKSWAWLPTVGFVVAAGLGAYYAMRLLRSANNNLRNM